MVIKARTPGGISDAPRSSRSMGTKGTSGVTSGHRSSFPDENQGLLARMDESKDNMSDGDYDDALRAAAAHPPDHMHDAGADHAQNEFEMRHDRRQGPVQTHEYEGGPRIVSEVEKMRQERSIDSKNFPASKDW